MDRKTFQDYLITKQTTLDMDTFNKICLNVYETLQEDVKGFQINVHNRFEEQSFFITLSFLNITPKMTTDDFIFKFEIDKNYQKIYIFMQEPRPEVSFREITSYSPLRKDKQGYIFYSNGVNIDISYTLNEVVENIAEVIRYYVVIYSKK